MKPGNWKPHQDDDGGVMWAVMAACVLIAVVLGSVEIMTLINIVATGPAVGDIVTFKPAGMGIDEEPMKVAVASPTARTCVLSPRVMRAGGGSLVVEARETPQPEPMYRVHWAGVHTTDGTGDCGRQANLVMSANDLRALASATGQLGPDGRIDARF
jgi:hypothetical protein